MGKTLKKIINSGLALVAGMTVGLSSVRSETYTVPLNLPAGARELNMIKIPAGSYMMGNNGSERDLNCGYCVDCSCEFPQHEVNISNDFYIGETEMTQAQFESVIGSNPSVNGVGDNYPVSSVSPNIALSFIGALNSLTGKSFRLPSESEWEYACRGPDTNPNRYDTFSFGDDNTINLKSCDFSSLFDQYMVWCGNDNNSSNEVASRLPNSFGLYDMHGNIMETCGDEWHENYNGAPNDGSVWLGPSSLGNYVARSGSWDLVSGTSRSSNRGAIKNTNTHYRHGFRLAIDANEIQTPTPVSTNTLTPTNTPMPTQTPYPTYTFRPTYTPYPTPTEKISIADVDNDGDVDMTDHQLFMRAWTRLRGDGSESNKSENNNQEEGFQYLHSDNNFDGNVDGDDLLNFITEWHKKRKDR